MDWFYRKRSSRVFVVYTALAMVGAFSFAATESLRSIHFELQDLAGDTIFNFPQDYSIQYPVEEPSLVTARGNGFLPYRGLQRFVFPWVLPDYETNFFGPSLAVISKTQLFDVKNTVLLKLRI